MADNDKIDKEIKLVVEKKTKEAFKKVFTQSYVEELRDRIVKRTQLGVGINPDKKLKKLSNPYKKQRKKKKAKLANTTTPARSNLTRTGQLLKSLTVIKLKIKDGIGFKITVGDRRGIDFDGKSSKIGNKKLVEYLKDQGREFLGFTKPQRNEILKEIRQALKKFL